MNNFAELLICEVQKRPPLWNKWNENYKNRILVDKEWGKVAAALNKEKEEVKLKWRNLRDQFQRELKKIRKPRCGDPGSPSIYKYTGKWVFFEMLSFLKDSMMPKRMDSNFNSQDVSMDNEADDEIENFRVTVANTSAHIEDPLSPLRNETPLLDETEETLLYVTPSTYTQPSLTCERGRKRKAPKLSDFEKNMLELENKKLAILMKQGSSQTLEAEIDEDVHFVKSLVPFLRQLNPLRKLIVRNEIQNLLIKELMNESPSPGVSQIGASSNKYVANNYSS